MKLLKAFLVMVLFILLLITADLIYFYRNEPEQYAKLYLQFALNASEKSDLGSSVKNLDTAAEFHLKKIKNNYNQIVGENIIKSDFKNLDDNTKKEASNYMKRILPKALKKNKAPLISNIYYNLALILYRNKFIRQADSLFSNAINLDPLLSSLYIELANSYYHEGEIYKSLEILKRCRSFKLSRKDCAEYLKSNKFLQVGSYKDIIYKYQKEFF